MQINIETLRELISPAVLPDKDISPYMTLKTKTVAQYYYAAETRDDLIKAVKATHELQLPLLLLGGGSNLAVMQDMINGLVVRNLYQAIEVRNETEETADLFLTSGYPMGRLVRFTVEKGLSGFEYHLGLPGSAGGAIYMNSKWTKPVSYFGDSLISASLIDRKGEIKIVDHDYFKFAYDYSILQDTKEIVLDAVFRLKKTDPAILQQRSKEALEYRKQTQPFGVATSGCFFRNISKEDQERLKLETTSAGYLIDQAGLKNTQIGSFTVSDKHANFVINQGGGRPEDLQKLIQTIKEKVKEKFDVDLTEEVVIM